MSGMMESIRRMLGMMPPPSYEEVTQENEALTPEAQIKRSSSNLQEISKFLGDTISDAIILHETMEADGHTYDVEVRQDKLLIQDIETQESRLIRMKDEPDEPYYVLEIELRMQLGQKIARLTPELDHEKKETLLNHTVQVLKAIARDQDDRVRMMIADELGDLPNAPHEVVHQLACDNSPRIAARILEFSPMLGSEELINILETSSVPGVSEAIARRSNVDADLSSAIIARRDTGAITQLLENANADISDDSMKEISVLAQDRPELNKPLAARPELTQRTVNRVAKLMAQNTLMDLEDEGKVKRKHKVYTRVAVNHRLDSPLEDQYRKAEKQVQQLHIAGKLTNDIIELALHKGEHAFVVAALAMRAMVSREKVKKILGANSARAVTALAWKAGLSMRTATVMQMKMSRIHHTKLIHARGGTDFPLSEEDMETYLDIFS